MKRKYFYIGLLAASTVLTSCDKYLDIKPVGTVIPTTSDDFRALMVSAYQSYPAHKSYLSLRTDELLLDEYSEDLSAIKDIYLWNDQNPDPTTTPYAYQAFYKSIFYANHILAEIDAKAGTSAANNQIKAEALALRAYAHFELLNMYAGNYNAATANTAKGIPLSTNVDLEQPYAPATVAAVFEQITKDVNQAEPLFTENLASANNLRYRFSKAALYALKSRISLYRSEWNDAIANAEKALSFNNKLEDLNTSTKLPNDYTSVEMIQALDEVGVNTVSRSTYISTNFMAMYNTDDLRKTKYFQKSGSRFVSAKGGSNQFNTSFRTGELYLTVAEASANADLLPAAKTALLKLAKNRLTPAYYTTYEGLVNGLDKQALLLEIYNERGRELSLEGLRWYDLKRTTQPAITHSFAGTTYTLAQGDGRYVIRYPRQATQNNPNL